jgi:hypothetical protein
MCSASNGSWPSFPDNAIALIADDEIEKYQAVESWATTAAGRVG